MTAEDIEEASWGRCKYVILGHMLGYPNCCTRSFIDDCDDARRIFTRGERLLDGTGFIPCSTCSVRYTEDELIAVINSQRMSILPPFPFYD